MIVQIFGILIMACIGIMFGKYWFKKLEEVEKAAFDEGYKTALSEMTRRESEERVKEVNKNTIKDWVPVKNPLTCFPVGTQQIVVRYKGASDNVRYYLEIVHAKELWQQLLTALIKVGEFAKQDISEEEKQEMVDAAIKVKNELD